MQKERVCLFMDTSVSGDRNEIKKDVNIRTLQYKYSLCETYKQKWYQ